MMSIHKLKNKVKRLLGIKINPPSMICASWMEEDGMKYYARKYIEGHVSSEVLKRIKNPNIAKSFPVQFPDGSVIDIWNTHFLWSVR